MIRNVVIAFFILLVYGIVAIDVRHDDNFILWQSHGDASRYMTLLSMTNRDELKLAHGGLCPGCRDHIFVLVWSVEAPTWLVATVLAVYPTVAIARGPLRRWRRRKRGACVACGYDLTGNVSGVCPECGTEIKKP